MEKYFKNGLLLLALFIGVSLGVNKAQAYSFTKLADNWTFNNTAYSTSNRLGTNNGNSYSNKSPFGTSIVAYSLGEHADASDQFSYATTTSIMASSSVLSWSFWFYDGNATMCPADGFVMEITDIAGSQLFYQSFYGRKSDYITDPQWKNISNESITTSFDKTAYCAMSGGWHFYTYVVTETSISFYIDTDLKYASTFDTHVGVSVGGFKLQNKDWTSENKGWSDFAFYNTSLTTAEISAIYALENTVNHYNPIYCGDGTCNGDETAANCFEDCAAPTIVILSSENKLTGTLGGNWTIPFYYNFCADYGYLTTTLYAKIEIGDDYFWTQIYDPNNLPQQCSGIKYLTTQISATTTDSGTTHADIVDDPVSLEVYAESQTIDWEINNGLSSNDYLDSLVLSPLVIQNGTATTTTIDFAYSVANLNYASSSVCFFNDESQNTTSFCSSLSATAGVGSIVLTNPSVSDSITGSFVLLLNDTIILRSKSFIINWFGYSQQSLENYLGTSTEMIVCSAEEWNTPDPVWGIDWLSATTSVPALNFTKLKCYFFLGILNIADGIANAPNRTYQSSKEALLTLFPINIPAQIKKSWDESATTTLPADLAFLDIADNDGNISLTLPSQFFDSTTTIPIWGEQIYGENEGVENAIGNIKSLSKYLLWVLFIFEIMAIGWKVWHDIDGETTEFDLEDININPTGGVSGHYKRK